jgi:hypothetical protein
MAILSCEHNPYSMGLCSQCSREVERSVDDSSRRARRREQLNDAADIAAKYGLHDIASRLRSEARS